MYEEYCPECGESMRRENADSLEISQEARNRQAMSEIGLLIAKTIDEAGYVLIEKEQLEEWDATIEKTMSRLQKLQKVEIAAKAFLMMGEKAILEQALRELDS